MFHEQRRARQPPPQPPQQPSTWKRFLGMIDDLNMFVKYRISRPMNIGECVLANYQSWFTQHAVTLSICLCVSITIPIGVTSLAVGLGVGLGVGCARTNTIYTNATNG